MAYDIIMNILALMLFGFVTLGVMEEIKHERKN
jgi:hypothetical protein